MIECVVDCLGFVVYCYGFCWLAWCASLFWGCYVCCLLSGDVGLFTLVWFIWFNCGCLWVVCLLLVVWFWRLFGLDLLAVVFLWMFVSVLFVLVCVCWLFCWCWFGFVGWCWLVLRLLWLRLAILIGCLVDCSLLVFRLLCFWLLMWYDWLIYLVRFDCLLFCFVVFVYLFCFLVGFVLLADCCFGFSYWIGLLALVCLGLNCLFLFVYWLVCGWCWLLD